MLCKKFIFVGFFVLSFTVYSFNIVYDKMSDYVVVGNDTDAGIKDFVKYIEKMSSVKLRIIDENSAIPAKSIIFSSNKRYQTAENLSEQGFSIRISGEKIIVYSPGKAGLWFGIYYLLDNLWGCRFLTDDFEYIPQKKTLEIPDNFDVIKEPSFKDRAFICVSQNSARNKDWQRKNKLGRELSGTAFHANYRYLPPAKYFDKHPEWYPMNKNGRRGPKVQWFCWTNKEMQKELEKNIRTHLKKLPQTRYLRMGQGDGSPNCYCASCQKIIKKYNSVNAPSLLALNDILKNIEKDFPSHKIITFAYHNTRFAPLENGKLIKLHPNLYLTYVNVNDHMKSFYSPAKWKQKEAKIIKKWKSVAANMNIWDWSVNFGYVLAPFPNIKARAEDIRWFKELGVRGFFPQIVAGGDFIEMREWLFARMLWDVNIDIEQAQKDFLHCYCGTKAGDILWKYLNSLQKKAARLKSSCHAIYGGKPENIKRIFFAGKDFEKAIAIFDSAVEAADSAIHKKHIRSIRSLSFEVLQFFPTRRLKRTVTTDKSVWILPDGKQNMLKSIKLMDEAFKGNATVSEHGGKLWQRKMFMANAGAKVDNVLQNSKIAIEFSTDLDGLISSIIEKDSGDNFLSFGKYKFVCGKNKKHKFIGGIYHHVGIAGGDRFKFKNENTKLRLTHDIRTNIWWNPGAIRGQRVYELQDNILYVSSKAQAVKSKALFFKKDNLSKTYNYHLNKKCYDNKLFFNISVKNNDKMKCYWENDGKYTQFYPSPGGIESKNIIDKTSLWIVDGAPKHSIAVLTFMSPGFTKISCERVGQDIIVTATANRFAVNYDSSSDTGKWSFRIVKRVEANKLLPVKNLSGRLIDGQLSLRWQNDGALCDIYADNTKINKDVISNGKFTASYRNTKRVVVFVKKTTGAEAKIKLSLTSGKNLLLVDKNNSFANVFIKLPKVPWSSDWNIEVESGKYRNIVLDRNIVKNMGKYTLYLRGVSGQKVSLRNVNLNKAKVYLRGFIIYAKGKKDLNCSANSRFRRNIFKGEK